MAMLQINMEETMEKTEIKAKLERLMDKRRAEGLTMFEEVEAIKLRKQLNNED